MRSLSPVTPWTRRSCNLTGACSGHDEIRACYGELFDLSPNLRVEIRNRIEVGSVVIDEEYITGFLLPDMPTEVHAAAVYRVADDLIQDSHLFRY